MPRSIFGKHQTDKTKYSNFYNDVVIFNINGKNFERILEIGAFKGGGMRSYKEFFPNAKVYGIDSDIRFKNESPDLDIFVGDQTDNNFLAEVLEQIGTPDLIIDDGGHKMSQQIGSFKFLFPKLASGGLYVIEDLETSYLSPWIDQEQTTVNFLHGLIDFINFNGLSHAGESGAEDIKSRGLNVSYYSENIKTIVFGNNIVAIVKK